MALTLRHMMKPILTLAVVGAGVGLIACGGDDASAEDERASFEDAQVEFAECMRENGVDMPDPQSGGGFSFEAGQDDIDPGSDEFQAAQEECGSVLDAAFPEGERPDPAEMRDQLHVMTECLRDAGYDVPEPVIAGPGEDPPGNATDPGEFREELEDLQDDPEFQQAQEDCRDEAGLEEFGPGGGPPTGGE